MVGGVDVEVFGLVVVVFLFVCCVHNLAVFSPLSLFILGHPDGFRLTYPMQQKHAHLNQALRGITYQVAQLGMWTRGSLWTVAVSCGACIVN